MSLNLNDINAKCFIMALFIRDDGERFLLGGDNYEFLEKQLHFTGNEMVNDTVGVQGNDGILLAGQVRRATSQEFDGYVGTFGVKKTVIEGMRRDFFNFFEKNHFYTVVYILPDHSAIKRQRGFITDAPEIRELWQMSPEYHIALNFEDVNYYSYSEDDSGNETFSGSVDIGVMDVSNGGLIWDNTGVVWDAIGAEWEITTGGTVSIMNNGTDVALPVWTVGYTATNPEILNITNNTRFKYNGTIASGQVLVVDSNAQTVKLDGLSVIQNMDGDFIRLEPGINRLQFTIASGTVDNSTLSWAEVVG